MPPKQSHHKAAKKQPQRTRMTNKAMEARQFSSVRVPRSSELPQQKINVDDLYAEQKAGYTHNAAASPARATQVGTSSSSATFDPIPNDPMFFVVENSSYWPPPTLEALQKTTGISVTGTDGFDAYDRAADDERAKKEKPKVIKGELNHPRGKPRQNTIAKFSDSDDDDKHEAATD